MLEEYQNIFEQFNLKVKNGYKGRGAYIVETDKGLKLFKETRMHPDKIKFMYDTEEYLYGKGFTSIDRLCLTNDNLPYCMNQDSVFIIKDWMNGREIFFNDEEEIMAAVQNLAILHKSGTNYKVTSKQKGYVKLGTLENRLNRHNRELIRIRNKIRKLGKWSEFDIIFLENYSYYFDKAQEAMAYIEKSQYNNLVQKYRKQSVIIHGQYIHHNILVKNNNLFTLNFEYCNIDLPILDLYRLLRKVLEKNDWSTTIGLKAIEKYLATNNLDKGEVDLLLYLFIYPQKFWKICNFYSNLNRAWKPKQSLIKLKKLNAQRENKEIFVEALRKSLK